MVPGSVIKRVERSGRCSVSFAPTDELTVEALESWLSNFSVARILPPSVKLIDVKLPKLVSNLGRIRELLKVVGVIATELL